MTYKNYYLAILLSLFLLKVNSQNCNEGNFNFPHNIDNYEFKTTSEESNHPQCSSTINFLTPYSPQIPDFNGGLDLDSAPVTFVSPGPDPTLFNLNTTVQRVNDNFGSALRLGFRNQDTIREHTTVLERNLGIVNQRFLNIEYSAIFHFPDDHPNEKLNFVKFSIINSSTGQEVSGIQPICLSVDDSTLLSTGSGSNQWRYSDWRCLSFDLDQYINGKVNLGLRIIAADCGNSFHDTLLYLDNICFSDTVEGEVSFNAFSVNCPTEPIVLNGNYTLPICGANDPTQIKLNLIPSNTNIPVTIAQNNFSNGSYSFTIDPTSLDPTVAEYNIETVATFSNGDVETATNPGPEITFINCGNPPPVDECDDYWVAILDEYIDGTQSGSNSVYLMANGNYPQGTNYSWTVTRQNGQVQPYDTLNQIVLVEASINNRIVSATVTVTYTTETSEVCTQTVRRRFACAIPNSDANGNLFPECNNTGGGFGRLDKNIRLYPNPAYPNQGVKIDGIDIKEINKVEIIDLFGNIKPSQIMKSGELQLGNLKTGIYFIKVSTKQGVIQKKLIIN